MPRIVKDHLATLLARAHSEFAALGEELRYWANKLAGTNLVHTEQYKEVYNAYADLANVTTALEIATSQFRKMVRRRKSIRSLQASCSR